MRAMKRVTRSVARQVTSLTGVLNLESVVNACSVCVQARARQLHDVADDVNYKM